MKKFFVKLGLRLLTIAALIDLARLIVSKMTGNANFTTPDPALADITDAADDLESSASEVAKAKKTLAEKVADQTQKEETLVSLLTNEGKYVDIKANGNKTIIESAGMGASSGGGPVGMLPQVHALSLTHGDKPGEVDSHWDSMKQKNNYTVQVCGDPIVEANYKTVGNPTKSKFTIEDLESGTKVWVRVCANGTAGSGPFSDPATIVVP